MGWEAYLTLGVLITALGLLTFTRFSTDLVLAAAAAILLLSGVIDESQFLSGFFNVGVWTIAVLFVVAAGLRDTGGMTWIASRLLGRPSSLASAQLRIMFPVAIMSAFMNNTPLVAMMMPVIKDWSKKCNLSPSKLLMPLSYASILGGACTLVGTSTNLIISGWMIDHAREAEQAGTTIAGISADGLGMFEMVPVAVPVALLGIGFVLLTSRWLLVNRRSASETLGNPREYTVELMVEAGGPLVGQTIEQAGLRNLPNAYLVEIDREGNIYAPVAPTEKLLANDRLVFVGVVESIVDMQKIRGLTPATEQVFKLDTPRSRRVLIEAVVSNSCPLRGRTIKEGRFRTVYNAAVIAVHRNGERIDKKIGDIVLQAGDTLLLETTPTFVADQRNSRDFFLVSQVEGSTPPRHERAPLAIGILVAMVGAVTLGVPIFQSALAAAGIMIATRCVSGTAGRASVDWSVIIVIAAAMALGKAMETSGLADAISDILIAGAGDSPYLALVLIYLITMALAGVITSKAAALLVLPVALLVCGPDHLKRQPHAVCDGDPRRLGHHHRHAHRLPDQPHGLRPRRLPLQRLPPHRCADVDRHRHPRARVDPPDLAAADHRRSVVASAASSRSAVSSASSC